MRTQRADERRFWSKVAPANEQGCMLWTGGASVTRGGGEYGRFWLKGRAVYAHRASYALTYGEVPEGLTVDHVRDRGCTGTLCVNPLHLEAVTNKENILRGDSWSGVNARKTHCPQGHPYDEENTRTRPRGSRDCRACDRARKRAHPDGR
ncbi:HNH endonuclease [Streptomyces nodosus]|uniref:HNH endonuclease n=1 Tax=Streptomyces nodosus TaxID=40318 RepID=UPI003453C4AD